MIIYFDEDNMPSKWTEETMLKALKLAISGENMDESINYSVSVSFVDLDEIHRLNREYRNVDKETDVLSFPSYSEEEIESLDVNGEEELGLGDVVICMDKAKAQAEEYGHPFERELIYLFVHSIFHLLGYDHESDEEKAEMRAKEERVMEGLGITR